LEPSPKKLIVIDSLCPTLFQVAQHDSMILFAQGVVGLLGKMPKFTLPPHPPRCVRVLCVKFAPTVVEKARLMSPGSDKRSNEKGNPYLK
jgi:hypothetical protein